MGAVIGGFIIGVLENLVGAYMVGTELKLTVALLVIIGALVVKPSGLFGKTGDAGLGSWRSRPMLPETPGRFGGLSGRSWSSRGWRPC